MKKTLLIICVLILPIISLAQVTTLPLTPTDSEEITIIFDATGTELDGYTGDVYAFTGVTVNGLRFSNLIGGWGDNEINPQLTRDVVNPNLYTLLITPSIFDYYDVPLLDNITELVFVFRSADVTPENRLQTDPDIFIPIIHTNPPPVLNNWGVVGSFNVWGTVSPDLPLSYNETTNNWSAVVTLTDGEIKFRANNDWAVNYGDDEPDGVLDQNGANISVSAGDYLVTVDFDTLEYSIVPIVNILDPNFEQALIDLEIDQSGVLDGIILKSEAENTTEINANFPVIPDPADTDPSDGLEGPPNPFADPRVTIIHQIADITGIEAFTNVTLLGLGYNALSTVDLSNNTKLDDLFISDNLLTSIDISNNTMLTRFGVMRNPNIGTVDVSKNVLLKELFLENTGISSIDLTNNLDLWKIRLENNNLTDLNISNNINLEELRCQSNNLTGVNASFNTKLTDINVRYNAPLTYLNLKNGNNKHVIRFDIRDTALTCITADGDYVSISESDSGVSQLMFNYSGGLLNEDCLTVYIPDANFELALIDLGVDVSGVQDHLILRSEAESTTDLNLFYPPFNPDLPNVNEKIVDLTGIEAFTSLQSLNAKSNDITELDVSNNLALKYLYFGGNELTIIDVSNNTALEYLDVLNNDLSVLDISQNTLIKTLAASYNNLNSIDISNNINATWFELNNNNLTSIDVSNNVQLEILNLQDNQLDDIVFGNHNSLRQIVIRNNNLSEIDVSNFSSLEIFFANNNLFTELDLSANTKLIQVNVSNNLLASLNVKNGSNINIIYFPAVNNPDLTCIQVDSGIAGTLPADWTKDDFAIYSSDCASKPEYVYIPDEFFEQSLIDIGIDSDDAVNTWLLKTDAEAVTDLNLNNSLFTPDWYGFNNPDIKNVEGKIGSFDGTLEGIQAFINLTHLQASYSDLTTINVSNNVALQELWVTDGILTGIDVTSNTNLIQLGVSANNITGTVDVSENTALELLFIGINPINSLDVTSNTSLSYLWVPGTQITSLDISLNPNLQRLEAQYNLGLSLITDPAGYPTMTSLNLSGINLANYNQYAPLFPNLQWLLLNDNSLTRFNGNNALLVENLFLNNNSIDKLVLSSNTALKQLHANNNVLTELDVKNGNNIALQTLNVTGNGLTCISVDNPDDVTMPYNSWNLDLGLILSTNCGAEPEVVLIPDANFEAALSTYDTNGMNGNILLSEAEAVTNLNVSSSNISFLTGIEAFVNLADLNVSGNLLEDLDLTENTDIVNLDVSDNFLNELIINSGRNLETLDISSNLFQTIDVSGFNNLAVFDATSNPNLLCIGVSDPNNIPIGWNPDNEEYGTYSSNADCIVPTISAQDVTIYLDNRGKASVTAAEFDNGSTDNVSANADLTFNLDLTAFTCSDLGLNEIELEVTDEAGNSAFQTVNLYVEDNIDPSVIANNPYTYDLNGMSAYTITPQDVVKSSSDNCSEPILSIDESVFTSTGTYTVTLTAEDGSENTAEDTIDIIIEDSAAGSGSASLSFKRNLNLTIFPVPFTDVININFSKSTDLNTVSVTLFDFNMIPTGVQFSDNAGNLISDFTGGLMSGVYILQITVGNETKTATIVNNN